MAPTQAQTTVILNLKRRKQQDFAVPVCMTDGSAVGNLVPLTYESVEDARIIDAIYRWRSQHITSFLTVFAPSPAKTREFLTRFSLPDPGRILFLITEGPQRFVGNIGLCNITAVNAELDNVLRGEPVNTRDFMVCAHNALLDWAFTTLAIGEVYLNVMVHNERAIRLYQKVGFIEEERAPLVRQSLADGYKLVRKTEAEGEDTGLLLAKMTLKRDNFCQRNRFKQGKFFLS